MNYIKTTISYLLLLIAFTSSAQTTPPPTVLSSADIDLFVKTLKPLQVDIEKLGDKYKNIGDPSALQALAANDEVRAIFKKHGWEDDFYSKVAAITNAFTYLKMEKEFQQLPAEQQAYMKQIIDQYKIGNKDSINEADLKLVSEKYDTLNTFFEEYSN